MFRIRMYDTYNLAKEMFDKPVLKWNFCRWRHSPCLPVWRHGNTIKLYTSWADVKENREKFRSEYIWSESGKKSHPILSKIFKRPIYHLPIWLSFYIFNHDLFWKTKWGENRFEYPPQLSIVFFGWSLNFWLREPSSPDGTNYLTNDADYWETLLDYIEYKNKFPNKIHKIKGRWGVSGTATDTQNKSYDRVRSYFFKENYKKYCKF